MTARHILLLVPIVSCGLMAGLFFGWLVSVIPGTARVEDRAYVSTMQHINVAIINPAFLIPFIATPFALIAAAIVEYRSGNTRRAAALGSSAAMYLIGVLGVTMAGNVPLNNSLDAFDAAKSSATQLSDQRASYEGPWNRWHAVRTAASVAAFGIAASAALITAESD